MAIDGNYKTIAESPMGNLDAAITLTTSGDELSGSVTTDMTGTVAFTGGKIDGDSFTVQFSAESPMGQMDMMVSGSVDGDKISGKIQTAMGDMSYEGNRA